MSGAFRLALHQTAPVRFDPEANLREVARRVASAEADLHLFPELSLTGYDLGGRAREFALAEEGDPPPLGGASTSQGAVVHGAPFLSADGRLFNGLGISEGDRWTHHVRKVHLPTYGGFDEGRIFAPGRQAPEPVAIAGWRVAFLVCEDIWHPILSWFAAIRGADLIVCAAAPPGRGIHGPDPGPRYASAESWRVMAQAIARQYGVPVAVCMRVGIEGALLYAGGSFVVDATGELIALASETEPETLTVRFERDDLYRARRPFSHLRDTDPTWVYAELGRVLGLGGDPEG